MSPEYPTNTKTTDNEGPLFCLYGLFGLKILNLTQRSRIVKTTNKKPKDNEGCLYVKKRCDSYLIKPDIKKEENLTKTLIEIEIQNKNNEKQGLHDIIFYLNAKVCFGLLLF